MHNDQITPFRQIPLNSISLLLGGITQCPEPVLDVDAPVDDFGSGNCGLETLAGEGAVGSVWGTEVSGCLLVGVGLWKVGGIP